MRQVAGYELLEILGRGGLGVVYRARQPGSGREVALKLGVVDAGHRQARSRREAEALARLRHPNLVRVHDAGEEGRHTYLVMELVEGGSLQARLERGGALPPREATRLVAALARGVAHAHARGILHRDIKPDNVILTAEGAPVLVDFGLARDLDPERSRLSRTGAMLGTAGYMPPEQARGAREMLPAADVYGLGATLYAALSGGPPFQADSLVALYAALNHAPPPPSQTADGIPAALDALCLRCLAPDPEQRLGSAEELAEQLEQVWDSVAAARRGPLLAAGAVLLGGLLGAGVWAGASSTPSAAPPPSRPRVASRKPSPPPSAPAANQRLAPQPSPSFPAETAGFREGERLRLEAVRGDYRGRQLGLVSCLVCVDERRVLTVSKEDLVLWDGPSGRRLASYGQVGDGGETLALAPEGDVFACGHVDGSVRLWELDRPEAGTTIGHHAKGVTAVAFTDHGRRVLSACWAPSRLRLWERTGGDPLMDEALGSQVYRFRFLPDGRLLLCNGNGDVQVWDLVRRVREQTLKTGGGAVFALAPLPDDDTVAVGTWQGQDLSLWSLSRGERVRTLTSGTAFQTAVVLLPGGERLVSGGLPSLQVWDVHTGQEVGRLETSLEGTVFGLDCTPSGASVYAGDYLGNLLAFDVTTGDMLWESQGPQAAITAVARTPRGELVAAEARNRVWTWPAAGRARVDPLLDSAATAAISADGGLVLATDVQHQQLSVLRDGLVRALRLPGAKHPLVAVSPDGRRALIAANGEETPATVVDTRRWGGEDLQGNPGPLLSAAFSADGESLVTAGADQTVRMWDSQSGKQIAKLEAAVDGGVAFVGPSRQQVLLGQREGGLRLWDLVAERSERLAGQGIEGLACSPQGRWALGWSGPNLWLWDLPQRRLVDTLDLSPSRDMISAGAFAGEERLLLGTRLGIVLEYRIEGEDSPR